MPVECILLEDRPVPLPACPKCGATPFEPFIRGTVQRRKNKFFFFEPWDYCALICSRCKAIVDYESPPKVIFDSDVVYANDRCAACKQRLSLNPVMITRHYPGFEGFEWDAKHLSFHRECYEPILDRDEAAPRSYP